MFAKETRTAVQLFGKVRREEGAGTRLRGVLEPIVQRFNGLATLTSWEPVPA